jgi:hypothetical protein
LGLGPASLAALLAEEHLVVLRLVVGAPLAASAPVGNTARIAFNTVGPAIDRVVVISQRGNLGAFQLKVDLQP